MYVRAVGLVAVVEDDAGIAVSIAAFLESDGVAVDLFASAEAFFSVTAWAGYGCVITDRLFPGMNGLRLAERVARQADAPHVIVMSGTAFTDQIIRRLPRSAADYIEKPFDPSRLLARVRAALSARESRGLR